MSAYAADLADRSRGEFRLLISRLLSTGGTIEDVYFTTGSFRTLGLEPLEGQGEPEGTSQ